MTVFACEPMNLRIQVCSSLPCDNKESTPMLIFYYQICKLTTNKNSNVIFKVRHPKRLFIYTAICNTEHAAHTTFIMDKQIILLFPMCISFKSQCLATVAPTTNPNTSNTAMFWTIRQCCPTSHYFPQLMHQDPIQCSFILS